MGKSSDYYKKNPDARKKKAAYDKEFNAKPEQKRKRRGLESRRRKDRARGIDTSSMDYDHAVGRRVPKSVNRGRNEKSRRKGSTRRKRK